MLLKGKGKHDSVPAFLENVAALKIKMGEYFQKMKSILSLWWIQRNSGQKGLPNKCVVFVYSTNFCPSEKNKLDVGILENLLQVII